MTWALLVLAAAPAESFALFQLEVGGLTVGVVELRRDERSYRYRSRPFFQPGREEVTALPLKGPTPEGLWLWAQPDQGCVAGIDELTGTQGPLCATDVSGSTVKGTMLGEAFTATYRGGALAELKVGTARFVRGAQATAPAGNPFTRGFAVSGARGPLALEPAVAGARPASPTPVGRAVKEGACLAAATEYLAAHPGAVIELGLVLDAGRAYPHAWVRDGLSEVDPSAVGPPAPGAGGGYLALPRAEAARVYLELLAGQRRVVRRAGP